jgi:beta-glucanase (GH16 family)
MMKFYCLLSFLVLLFIAGSCKDDDGGTTPVMPSDLSFEVMQNAENPTMVAVNISAQKANFYRVYFGEEGEEVPQATKEETVSHTYSQSGTYTIRVQAHATEIYFISESQSVTIEFGDDTGEGNGEIPSEGYSTPESYEGMQLVWQDEFEGSQLNLDDWTFETGTGANGWGNNELQYYRKENTSLEDGYLIITAKKEAYQGREYTSSRIVTQGKQSFRYGRIDIRAALPKGQGIWPALWMLGSSFAEVGWPASGEIDIMEMIGGGAGRDNTVHGTVHWSHGGEYASYGQGYTLPDGIFADKFHVFTIAWDESSITWYVDDVEFNKIDITHEELSEFQQEFFFIFNVAVGGNWPGNPNESTHFPQRMVVDYVRVFQPE